MNTFKALILMSALITSSLFGMNKEIEYKFSLSQTQYDQFIAWLKSNDAIHTGMFTHDEEYFSPVAFEWSKTKTLRVRTATNLDSGAVKCSTCYKKAQEGYREEYETTIQNAEVLKSIYRDYFNASTQTVHKIRNTYLWNNMLEIAFDEVEELRNTACGNIFVEIEVISPMETIQDGISLIEGFLKSAGINTFTKFHKGYIHMIVDSETRQGTEITLN